MKTFITKNILEWRKKNKNVLAESQSKSLSEISESLSKLKEKVESIAANTSYEN